MHFGFHCIFYILIFTSGSIYISILFPKIFLHFQPFSRLHMEILDKDQLAAKYFFCKVIPQNVKTLWLRCIFIIITLTQKQLTFC